jgi:hypothetical protein
VLHLITRSRNLTITKDSSFKRGSVSTQDKLLIIIKIAVPNVREPTILLEKFVEEIESELLDADDSIKRHEMEVDILAYKRVCQQLSY